MPKIFYCQSFSPTYATTLTGSLQGLSLEQNQAVYNDILLYYNAYVKPYYRTVF